MTTTEPPTGERPPTTAGPIDAIELPPPSPVGQTDRIASIDVLRGVALLGILVMNIQAFSMVFAAYSNPMARGSLETGTNFGVWLVEHLFVDMKMMSIFSMLFGAGLVLMAERMEQRGTRPARRHYMRMLGLLLFGLIHGYFFWLGDILFAYALCGMLIYPLRRLGWHWLLPIAFVAAGFPSLLGLSAAVMPEEWLTAMREMMRPTAEAIAEETEAYRGTWLTALHERAPATFMANSVGFLFASMWRISANMLLGIVLYRYGVFSARHTSRFYTGMWIIGWLIGLPLVAGGVWYNFRVDWELRWMASVGFQFNYWGSFFVAFGWIGLVMIFCRSPLLGIVKKALAAVGQMALTNYLLHTLICTTIFYGYGIGFGLFEKLDRLEQFGVVLVIWAFQLAISPWWLARFRFGPFEWLWRSMTYRKWQPLRR